MTPTPYISATERIYLELSRPEAPQPKPASAVAEPKKVEPTRADVNELIQRQRVGTPEELEAILANARALRLTDGERQQLSVDASMAMARKTRAVNGRRDDPSAQFISQVLGLAETPWGMIDRAWINNHLRAGAQAIMRCRNHRPPACQCWAASRVTLWQAQANGEKSPEGWAASRIYDFLEELGLSSRPERGPGVV
jgi:hypothetical protein